MTNCEACNSPLLPGAFFCGECGSSTRPRIDPGPVVRTDTQAVPLAPAQQVPPAPPSIPTFSEPVAPSQTVPPSLPPAHDPFAPPPAAPTVSPVAPSSTATFTLQFSNGDAVTVTNGGLLGRNPAAATGETAEHLIIVTDPDRTVSKTHLEFGIEEGSFWVCDRFSGNGTTVHEQGRPSRRLVPGRRYRIERGTLVGIGEQSFTVI